MSSYLLLRDNKESGPYTMEELLHFGLKPYDLVWLKGKSAAWRYPSEVEELKAFAPIIEEQPYDRFYKKNQEEKKEELFPVVREHRQPAPVAKEKETPVVNEYSRYIPAAKDEGIKFIPKKSVFVTLPDQKQMAVKQIAEPVKEISKPSSIPAPAPTIPINETPVVAEIKYSQPLDEIKEMYVKTLQHRKGKNAKRLFLISLLKKVAVFGGLIVLGILTGFIIKSKSGKEDKVVQQHLMQASPLVISNPADELSSEFIKEKIVIDPPVLIIQKGEQALSKKIDENQKTDEEPTTVRIRKETMLIIPKQKEEYESRQEIPGTKINPITGERERIVRSSTEVEKEVVNKNKNGLNDLVSVESNDYKRVAFGGIRNLYLTVTNKSKYELDNVIVELLYVKPSEEPLRTENIKFKSIAPNTSSTIKIPDTNRGIRVEYKIINIDSKQKIDDVAGM